MNDAVSEYHTRAGGRNPNLAAAVSDAGNASGSVRVRLNGAF
jgi:hypothetical protein